MRIWSTLIPAILLGGWLHNASAQDKAPIAGSPVVETRGVIEKVQTAMGQGMPYLVVKNGGKSVKIYLGSMRYLMEQNFNPKAGADVVAKGYKMNGDVIAISVTLPAENKTIKLRDENGWPVWRQGQHGEQHQGGRHKKQ